MAFFRTQLARCFEDQHVAMFGWSRMKGEENNTYGTRCFILLNTSHEFIGSVVTQVVEVVC